MNIVLRVRQLAARAIGPVSLCLVAVSCTAPQQSTPAGTSQDTVQAEVPDAEEAEERAQQGEQEASEVAAGEQQIAAGDGQRFDEATDVIYTFGAPPVAPQYRRNRAWHVTPSGLHFTVGMREADDIKSITVPTDDGHWAAVLDALGAASLTNEETTGSGGCTGGTTRSLRVLRGDDELYSGSAYVCADESVGTLNGDHEAVLDAIQRGIDPSVFEHD